MGIKKKLKSRELIANLFTETQSTFQVDFCKILHPEATGERGCKEHAPGAVGALLKKQGSNLPNTISALLMALQTAKSQANTTELSGLQN